MVELPVEADQYLKMGDEAEDKEEEEEEEEEEEAGEPGEADDQI